MKEQIIQAAKLMNCGKLVSFPTETVYALSASALNEDAIQLIYKLKGRDYSKPLALFCKNLKDAEAYVHVTDKARRLADRFCPGPITLVLPKKADCPLPAWVNSGLPTLAIRIPDHPVAQAILSELPYPIVATSTNPSGQPEAVTASQVKVYFGNKIDKIIEGEGCGGVVSTVVDISGGEVFILREGAISKDAIWEVI